MKACVAATGSSLVAADAAWAAATGGGVGDAAVPCAWAALKKNVSANAANSLHMLSLPEYRIE